MCWCIYNAYGLWRIHDQRFHLHFFSISISRACESTPHIPFVSTPKQAQARMLNWTLSELRPPNAMCIVQPSNFRQYVRWIVWYDRTEHFNKLSIMNLYHFENAIHYLQLEFVRGMTKKRKKNRRKEKLWKSFAINLSCNLVLTLKCEYFMTFKLKVHFLVLETFIAILANRWQWKWLQKNIITFIRLANYNTNSSVLMSHPIPIYTVCTAMMLTEFKESFRNKYTSHKWLQ